MEKNIHNSQSPITLYIIKNSFHANINLTVFQLKETDEITLIHFELQKQNWAYQQKIYIYKYTLYLTT